MEPSLAMIPLAVRVSVNESKSFSVSPFLLSRSLNNQIVLASGILSDNSKFKKGDEVILTGWRVGEIYYGGYSQLAKVNGDFLVKKPKNISSKQAMILGTAGLTALLCSFAIKAREELLLGEKVKDVLVTGASGGVGSIAVMILSNGKAGQKTPCPAQI